MSLLFVSPRSLVVMRQYEILSTRRRAGMDASWFALLNAVLFAVQAGVNIAYAHCFVPLAREYETLIAPASFALSLWVLVYALEALLVLTDVFYPQYSLYADATQPAQLRTCFAVTCVANTAWVILYVKHAVHGATVMIYVLWLALLVLYIYSVNDRNSRGAMDWRQYACNELPVALYFAWVSALAFNHLAISLQVARGGGFLSVATYVVHLCIVITFAIMAVLYAKDPVFALVTIWYLVAVAVKDVSFPDKIMCADMSVRACAGEGAGIVGVLLVLSTIYMTYYERLARAVLKMEQCAVLTGLSLVARWHATGASERPPTTAGGMAVVQSQSASGGNYGSTA